MEKHEADPDGNTNRVGGINKGLNCKIEWIDYKLKGVEGLSKAEMMNQIANWALANAPKVLIGLDPDRGI